MSVPENASANAAVRSVRKLTPFSEGDVNESHVNESHANESHDDQAQALTRVILF